MLFHVLPLRHLFSSSEELPAFSMAARVLRWVRRFAQAVSLNACQSMPMIKILLREVADGGYTSPKLKKLENPNVGAYLVTSEPIARPAFLAQVSVDRSEVIFEVDLKVEGRVLPEPNTYSVQAVTASVNCNFKPTG